MSYRLEILNVGKWSQVTSCRRDLKNVAKRKLTYNTKNWRKLAKMDKK